MKDRAFLFIHGVQDSVLPVDWARKSRDTLQKMEADVEYYEFNMGHNITSESLRVISAWLEKKLSK